MKKSILILVLSLFVSSISFSQTRAERKQAKKERIETQYNETKALIESGSFQFEAKWAIPLGNDISSIGLSLPGGGAVFQGGRVDISNNSNKVSIDANNADVYLPYFGRVFFPKRISNERGIQYKGEIEDYTIDYNEKKKVITIKFKADSPGDFLKFIYRINYGGNTTITVNSTNRQTISYNGKITALKEKGAN
ncbi:DUF4251 domain-containing protein [uncultured Winogradskyella sp.]|uniref:DUF4251 domain-containing protein n=1 Tax=uncultured Winogradskyella sp. TaxID=395353 RepID=UPI0026173276|nr:DUF4251 domain-containing protein [uncultured Winogradskyella sp.]